MKLYLPSVPFRSLILSILILCSFISFAEIRYVSKTGSSTPPYLSWETASDSIMKAVNISGSGDTIYVANGVYYERIFMIPGLSLIGSGMDSCIINSSGIIPTNTSTVRMTDSCLLKGFHLIPYYNTEQGRGILIFDANILNTVNIIEQNKITSAYEGIRVSTSSLVSDPSYKLITKNIISNVRNYCIWGAMTRPLITENVLSIMPDGFAIGGSINWRPTILNNIIHCNDCSPAIGNALGGIMVIRSNLIYGWGDETIYGTIEGSNDAVYNNIVIGNFEEAIRNSGIIKNNIIQGAHYGFGSYGGTPVFQYNNLWENQVNYKNFTGDSTNISYNPMFVNPDSLDFHLQKYSPLIDAGDPSMLDKDGSRSDIGMFGGPFGESYEYIDLAPRTPVNFTADADSNEILLKWNRNTEADFHSYRLYTDTVSGFPADSTKLISQQTDTFFVQRTPVGVAGVYYRVAAVDSQGNESLPSQELSIILSSLTNEPSEVSDYILYQNYPNPFNPSTRIGYRLKERGYVKLLVYDIKGELVETLVNKNQEKGYYEIEFTGKNSTESDLASGIYIYQLMIRQENGTPVFSDLKKMIHLK